jgi:hypothetical protein
MVEPSEHPPLAAEPSLLTGVDARQRDDLERYRVTAHLIVRAVHDPDASAPDLALDDESPGERLGRRLRHHARFSIPTT